MKPKSDSEMMVTARQAAAKAMAQMEDAEVECIHIILKPKGHKKSDKPEEDPEHEPKGKNEEHEPEVDDESED